jgi:mannose/cellobiose epimerase-like protein (N-acyl-D-glucosamine 2-epimerase family)
MRTRGLWRQPGHKGANRQVHETSRLVHSFAIAHLLGLPGADCIVDHGMAFLWERMRDGQHGGYFWAVDDEKPTDPTKQAYGHAFVLLAASSAMCVGHPDALRLIEDVTQVIEILGQSRRRKPKNTIPIDAIKDLPRQNSSNLRDQPGGCPRGDRRPWLSREGGSIASFIDRHARTEGWRVAETFHRELGCRLGI